MTETYYDLLGVNVDASEKDIHQAYRKLVREVHPDLNEDPDAREQMVELTKAREVLTDPKKRRAYDSRVNVHEEKGQGSNQSRSQTRHYHYYYNQQNQSQQRQRRSRKSRRTNTETASQESQRSRTRSRRTRTRSRQRTRTRSRPRSQTSSQQGTIGSVPLRIRLRYLFDRLLYDLKYGCRHLVSGLFSLISLRFIWGNNWQGIRSILTSPTILRLAAGFGIWWVVLHAMRLSSFGGVSNESRGLILAVCVFVSYLTHDLVGEYIWFQKRAREPFQPQGASTLGPIIVTNLVGIGLFFWARSTGARLGGIGFAFTTTFGFLALVLIFGFIASVILFAIGANVSQTLLSIALIAGPFIGLLITIGILFTSYFPASGSISQFLHGTPASLHPWIGPQTVGQVGPVYVGLILNAILGTIMIWGFLGSLLAMIRALTKVPWSDRFQHGYHVRPGIWNYLTVLPFVLFAGMAIQHVYAIPIPVGGGQIVLTIDRLLYLFGVLPAGLTALYLLRRWVEPWVQRVL